MVGASVAHHSPPTPPLSSDLALRNCLLTSDLTVRIGDYGLAHSNYKVGLPPVGVRAGGGPWGALTRLTRRAWPVPRRTIT
jgi:hypothetical protein